MTLAGLTLLIVIAGWIQLRSIRREADKERTIAMCNRYEFDPVLDASARRLSAATAAGGDFATNPSKYKSDVVTVLNYLDALAVGIKQGIYIEALAQDHTHVILKGYVKAHLDHSAPQISGIEREHFRHLLELYDKWSKEEPKFKPGWKFWRR
jgi:hypothetical protein